MSPWPDSARHVSRRELDRQLETQLNEAVKPLLELTPRVRLRLGFDDPITKECVEIAICVNMMTAAARHRRNGTRSIEEAIHTGIAAWERMVEASIAFSVAATDRAGAALPPSAEQ
jgi:hypothetical protein